MDDLKAGDSVLFDAGPTWGKSSRALKHLLSFNSLRPSFHTVFHLERVLLCYSIYSLLLAAQPLPLRMVTMTKSLLRGPTKAYGITHAMLSQVMAEPRYAVIPISQWPPNDVSRPILSSLASLPLDACHISHVWPAMRKSTTLLFWVRTLYWRSFEEVTELTLHSGAPFDTGTSYRPGARFGPNGIRQGSRRLNL